MFQRSELTFRIGAGCWIQEILHFSEMLELDYWKQFTALSEAEVARVEESVGRTFPLDFRQFLQVFGCGEFHKRFGGDIYEPAAFVNGCHGHIWMLLGSSEWASEEQQRRLYVSRGIDNPNPERYTADVLRYDGINLLDLIQFGTNGLACYHQLYVGESESDLGYCLATPEGELIDRERDFSEGFKSILMAQHDKYIIKELPPEGSFEFE